MPSDGLRKRIQTLAKDKNFANLGKLLSEIEKAGAQSLGFKELLSPPKPSFRIGITGSPGVGKSTLISSLIGEFRKKNMSVGVLAVDPTSPFTQGAILGDRLRSSPHFTDDKVFIRSLGSRGFSGGINASVYLMLRALDFYQFDIVIIETVGVGQTEVDIMNTADVVAIVLSPESGDSIQTMKAGLFEIGDVFVINKSDRPGSEILLKDLAANNELVAGKKLNVFLTSAIAQTGVDKLAEFFLNGREQTHWKKSRNDTKKLRAEAASLLFSEAQQKIVQKVSTLKTAADLAKMLVRKT